MMIVPAQARSVAEALGLGPSLLDDANAGPLLAASVVTGPAVILGARQRAGRVVDGEACRAANVSIYRRVTTGTAVWIGGSGIVLTLVLPHVAAIAPDATPRTLLNRNVRPFLRAFTRAGAMAHYFGREWISLKQRPLATLAYDVTRHGAVLLEVFVGCDQPVGLPDKLQALEERMLNRCSGKTPASLSEVLPSGRWLDVAARVIEDVAGKGANHFGKGANHLGQVVKNAEDPVPNGFVLRKREQFPIGHVELAVSCDDPTQRWLGGDVLAPRWLYEDLAAGVLDENVESAPIDGARLNDLLRFVAIEQDAKTNAT